MNSQVDHKTHRTCLMCLTCINNSVHSCLLMNMVGLAGGPELSLTQSLVYLCATIDPGAELCEAVCVCRGILIPTLLLKI